jgi:hypothetical protein
MTTWDQAKTAAEKPMGSGIFIRLADDGDKFTGAFMGDPHIREIVWEQAKGSYRDATPADTKAGTAVTQRFICNVYVPADKAMKVFEMNQKTFQGLLGAREKFAFSSWYFEVKRNGKKGDTKTTYQILPDTQIPADDAKAMAALKLHDLKASKDEGGGDTDLSSHDKAKNGAATNGTAGPAAAAAPPAEEYISAETASALVTRLKILPREKVALYLEKFGVTTVKTTKKADAAAASAFVDTLEGKAPAAPEEVDPLG